MHARICLTGFPEFQLFSGKLCNYGKTWNVPFSYHSWQSLFFEFKIGSFAEVNKPPDNQDDGGGKDKDVEEELDDTPKLEEYTIPALFKAIFFIDN